MPSIETLVRAAMQDLRKATLRTRYLDEGHYSSSLERRFAEIERSLCGAIQELIDQSIDDGGITAL